MSDYLSESKQAKKTAIPLYEEVTDYKNQAMKDPKEQYSSENNGLLVDPKMAETKAQKRRVAKDDAAIDFRHRYYFYDMDKVQTNGFTKRKYRKVLREYLEKHTEGEEREAYHDFLMTRDGMENGLSGFEDRKTEDVEVTYASSKGSHYALAGEDTLEFELSGSGGKYFFREKSRLHSLKDTGEEPMEEMKASGRIGTFFRKVFGWLPGVRRAYTEKEAEDYNRIVRRNRRIMEQRYGTSVTLKRAGKTRRYKNIRKKETVNSLGAVKTRYNIAGVQSLFGILKGALNAGTYSMENVEEYVLSLGSQWLKPRLDAMMKDPSKVKPLHIMVRGHSRGGAAAPLAMMRLNQWLYENYPPEYAELVQYDTEFHDSVPGKFSRTGIRKRVDIASDRMFDRDGNEVKSGGRYRGLGNRVNGTVFYCLRTLSDLVLDPMEIRGANRVLLTAGDHTATGFPGIETDNDGVLHKKGYYDPLSKKLYRGSAVNDIPKGLYFIDHTNMLIKIHSYEEYRKIREQLLSEFGSSQKKRAEVLDRVAEEFFRRDLQQNGK